ncbi:hypothetical protein [Flavobacterium collinsii]|nr:hypothetical protein [Flavobacterium collinsii]
MDVVIKRAIGSTNIVTMDFNSSYKMDVTAKRAVGSVNILFWN